MKKNVIIDTGALVAFINKKEQKHLWLIEQWKKIIPPFFTCEAVITETCFLLQDVYEGEEAILTLIERQVIQLPFQIGREYFNIRLLMKRYKNIPMSLADACLVRMSELIKDSCILTLDSDFLIYRRHKNELIELIIPDN